MSGNYFYFQDSSYSFLNMHHNPQKIISTEDSQDCPEFYLGSPQPSINSQPAEEREPEFLQLPKEETKAKAQKIPRKKEPTVSKTKKVEKVKNNNVVKKLGRIIYNRREQFKDVSGNFNKGVKKMCDNLQREYTEKSKKTNNYDIIDGFNTYRLNDLLETDDSSINTTNLRISQHILNKHLRKDVFGSKQLANNEERSLLYLNTLKCSSLRMVNNSLALRLKGVIDMKFEKEETEVQMENEGDFNPEEIYEQESSNLVCLVNSITKK